MSTNPLDATGAPVVGIVGSGQLGKMMAAAALRLGLDVRFFSESLGCAGRVMGEAVLASPEDREAIRRFVGACSVVTFENEWGPADLVAEIAGELGVPCWPRPATFAGIADKGLQKDRLVEADLAVGPYRLTKTLAETEAAAAEFGYPLVVKRRHGAYDGYGNRVVRSADELADAFEAMTDEARGVLVEAWVPYRREVAVVVARGATGDSVSYPVAETVQENQKCAAVLVPADGDPKVHQNALAIAARAVAAFDVVGVCAVEMFELEDGTLLVNELAPRPHNSGHYTIEASHTSQYENHLRAVLGLPLGDPGLRVPAVAMVNILGPAQEVERSYPDLGDALRLPGVSVHLYGKRDVRAGRKLGHVTVTGDDVNALRQRADEAAAALRWDTIHD